MTGNSSPDRLLKQPFKPPVSWQTILETINKAKTYTKMTYNNVDSCQVFRWSFADSHSASINQIYSHWADVCESLDNDLDKCILST